MKAIIQRVTKASVSGECERWIVLMALRRACWIMTMKVLLQA